MWDGDTDDYEYQQASMEMSGPDDDLLAEGIYAPQSGEEYFLGREDAIRATEAELYNFERQNRFDDGESIYVESDDSLEGSITIRDGFAPRLKAILSKYKKLVDVERYKSAIRELSSITCNEDNDNLLGGFFYDDSDGLYYDTCDHTNDDAFFGVNIHYIKNLDSRLLLIFPRYIMKRYGFSRWFAELSSEQRAYARDHIDLYNDNLTDKQLAVLKSDITVINSETINIILAENDDDFACDDCWNHDGFVDHHKTKPLEGSILRDFKNEQFDQLIVSIPELSLNIIEILVDNYTHKLSVSLWSEIVKRFYAEAILCFGGNINSIFSEIDDENTDNIKHGILQHIPVNVFLWGKSDKVNDLRYSKWLEAIENEREYYAKYAKRLLDDRIGSANKNDIQIDDKIDVIIKANDFYKYYMSNVYKKYRRTGSDSYHLWGLRETYQATGGNKLKTLVEDNVLSFARD